MFKTYATNIFLSDGNDGPDVCVRDLVSDGLTVVSHSGSSSANGPSYYPTISSNGRWVAFASNASNIVTGDTNGTQDAFRYDRTTGARVRMSIATNGAQSTGSCFYTSVTDAGEVVFASTGADLVSGDSGSFLDVFVRNPGPDYPRLYCTGKLNSAGCVPFLDFSGAPGVTATQPFAIRGHDFLPGEPGFLIYGTSGKSNQDFHGGKLCVKLPFRRWLPFKHASGTGGGCSGVLTRNFNARFQIGP